MLTVISVSLLLAMLGLFGVSIAYVSKNITKIDLLKGTFKFSDPQNLAPNPYDLGALSNFANVFEGNVWKWWIPTTLIAPSDSTHFPTIPPVRR